MALTVSVVFTADVLPDTIIDMETKQAAGRADLRESYEDTGYLTVPDFGLTQDDISEVRGLLEGLFARYSVLPFEFAHDMAAKSDTVPDRAAPKFPEINRCTILEPRLLKTRAYAALESLARELLGRNSLLVFDHAMYKPPGKNAPTSWHQDTAFGDANDSGVALWLPLQPTSVEDGCLRYVPYSHLGPNLTHQHELTAEQRDVYFLDESQFDVEKAISMPLELGSVCGHDRKTIHGAWPNVGNDTRRAWITLFTAAPLSQRVRFKASAVKRKIRPVV
jgi:ectoine hydroxylase-related dioxygenase (phytanoyl-CoA dioxygenase family)